MNPSYDLAASDIEISGRESPPSYAPAYTIADYSTSNSEKDSHYAQFFGTQYMEPNKGLPVGDYLDPQSKGVRHFA